MHPFFMGLLAGIALAVLFVGSEYFLLKSAAEETARRLKRKPEFDQTARKRMRQMWRFALILPLACAIAGWMILPLFGF